MVHGDDHDDHDHHHTTTTTMTTTAKTTTMTEATMETPRTMCTTASAWVFVQMMHRLVTGLQFLTRFYLQMPNLQD